MTINAALDYLRDKNPDGPTKQLIGWLEELRGYRAANTVPVVQAEPGTLYAVQLGGPSMRIVPVFQNTCDGTPHCIHCAHYRAGLHE
jgi:hypothetical protein